MFYFLGLVMKIEELQELPTQERKALMARRAKERQARQEKMGEQRRELLLDVASDLLTEVGWDGFNLRDMAARAGYSAGAIYAYFDGKEHLLACLRVRWLQGLRVSVEQARIGRTRASPKWEGPPWQQIYLARMHVWWVGVARNPSGWALMLFPWQAGAQPGASLVGLLPAMEEVTSIAQDALEEGWVDGPLARKAHGDILALGMGYLLALGPAAEPAMFSAMESRFVDAMLVRLSDGQRLAGASADVEAQPDLFSMDASERPAF